MDNNNIPKIDMVAEKAIFDFLWRILPPKSFLSGMWLRNFEGSPFHYNMFAHVLPKAQNKYPHFRYYMKNIVLLTPGEHALYDQGTEEAREKYSQEVERASGGKNKADWGKLEALANDLKADYKKYFPTRIGLVIGYKYNLREVQEIIGKLNVKYMGELKNSLSLVKIKPDE